MSDKEKTSILENDFLNKLKTKKTGIVSLPIFIIFSAIIFIGMYTENIPVDLMGGLAVIIVLGWLLGAVGEAIPVFNKFGGSTILAILVPAILVLFNLLPQNSIDAVNLFMGDISFQNLYIFALVAGSILGMNRIILIRGFARMLLPMATGFFTGFTNPFVNRLGFRFGF